MTAPPGGQTLAGWPVGAAYMPPGTFAAAETPRAAYMRPLQTVPKNGVGGLVRRGGIHAARDVCGSGNSAGRIYAAPTNRSEKWRLRVVCRGGIHASRDPLRRRKNPGRDKSLPYALPANNRLHDGASGTPPPTEACTQTAGWRCSLCAAKRPAPTARLPPAASEGSRPLPTDYHSRVLCRERS